ncbi:MAG: hypothetical protein ABW277_18415 [Longimicrobiaceae bacterium]
MPVPTAVLSLRRALRQGPALLGCVVLLASLGACRSDAVEPLPRLALEGVVRRADTGVPLPGARVALVAFAERDGGVSLEIAAETTADERGRYALTYPAAEGVCEELRLQATVGSWQNPNIASEPSRELECTSAAQRVDVRLVFSGF